MRISPSRWEKPVISISAGLKKIKKKSIIIDDIMINREPANIESMKVKLDDIKPYSCQYVSVD